MQRSALDKLVSMVGFVLAAVLVVAGALLTYANTYITDQVRMQLKSQHITMPSGADIDDPRIKPFMEKYAGQEMVTGDQAYDFAEHYIAVQMEDVGDGMTFQEVSAEYSKVHAEVAAQQAAGQTVPPATLSKLEALEQTRQTMFMGNTLRGMLLDAYAFWTVGKIAGYAAITAYVGAVVLLALGLFGLRHARQASDPS